MGGGHAKVLAQLVGANDAGQVLGQRVEQGVVDLGLLLGHHKGHQQHKKDDHDGHCVLGNKVAELGQLGNAVHHSGNVLAEHLCNFFNGDIVPILNRIMKQTRNDRVCIHVHIEQNERNGFGMNIIRFLRFSFLVSMNRFCKINCLY